LSTVLSERELKESVRAGRIVLDGKESSVEGLKYDFALGSRMLFGGRAPINTNNLTEQERSSLVVKPGELVYVMSEEQVDLPMDIKADLSLKRKISHLGIQVLGGSSIDPGYKGRLVFALHNLSTRPFPLQPGRKLIAAQFYRLTENESPPANSRVPEPLYEFPDDLVQLMAVYEPATTEGLRQSVHELARTVDELKRQIEDKEEWYTRFQDALEKVTKSVAELTANVDKLQSSLRDEVEARKQTSEAVASLRTGVAVNNTRLVIFGGIVLAIVAGVAGFLASKL
jgi:deoxycytidine triphosphate deaminase